MFTFGLFTTYTPYLLLVFGYLFYFVTATVDQDLADKWFSPDNNTLEILASDKVINTHNCIDYHYACIGANQPESNSNAFALTKILRIAKPQTAIVSTKYYAPLYSRPPTT